MRLQIAALFSGIIISCLNGVKTEISLDYSEIERLGTTFKLLQCPQLDSCNFNDTNTKLRTKSNLNCACDKWCPEYADCCIDAEQISIQEDGASKFSCYELKQYGGVFMRGTCPSTFQGPKVVRKLCESPEPDESDPIGFMPVTNSETRVTYRNYYCSMCNNDVQNIILWLPRVECPTVALVNESRNITEDYVLQNLEFGTTNWGVHLTLENDSDDNYDQDSYLEKDDLFFHECTVYPTRPASLENKIRLCKPDLISDCPTNWQDNDVRAMCRSYMGVRTVRSRDLYKNPHCALCNGLSMAHLSCQSAETRDFNFRDWDTQSFSLLLDISEARGDEVGLIQVCEKDEVFDPFFKRCRSLTCLRGYFRRGNECILRNLTEDTTTEMPSKNIIISSDGSEIEGSGNVYSTFVHDDNEIDVTENSIDKSKKLTNKINVSHLEDIDKSLDCLLISLKDEDYVRFPNKSLYVPKYDKMYEKSSYHEVNDSIFVCSPFVSPNDQKFLHAQGYVTIVGLGISMICILLHFVAFCLVPDLRNLSGKSLMSQCIALFLAYICFIIGLFDSSSLGYEMCTVVAFGTFYFFQVSFYWMAVMAFDVWRTLRLATKELRVASGKQLKRFLIYSVIGWILPMLIGILLAVAEFTDVFPLQYRPGFANPRCWFKKRRSLTVFFAAPLIGIMISNIIFFVLSTYMIFKTTKSGVKQQNEAQRRNYKLYMRLALIMGLTWLTGILAGYSDQEFLWYIFILFNTFQGLFIFLGFTCSTKVRKFLTTKVFKTPRTPETTSHSNTSGSGCHTNSTNLHSNLAKKVSSRFLLKPSRFSRSSDSVKSPQINGAF